MRIRVHNEAQRARRMLTDRARRSLKHWRDIYGKSEGDARYEAYRQGALDMQHEWERAEGLR